MFLRFCYRRHSCNSNAKTQESWLASTFNCQPEKNFGTSLPSGAIADSEVFYASDDSAAESDSCLHASDSAGSVLCASDEDLPVVKRSRTEDCPGESSTRSYASRTTAPFKFLDEKVCRSALIRLLGVGNSTLAKIRKGEKTFTNKSRPKLPKHPTFNFTMRGEVAQLWEQVVCFLWCVYHSSAEVMPNRYKMPGESSLETPFPIEQDHDAVSRLVNGFQLTLHTKSSDPELAMVGPGTFAGCLRALPHGNRTELYWEYCAFCQARGQPQASYSTFLRVSNPILKPGTRNGHLRFRQQSEHAQCDQCFGLKQGIQKAKTEQAKNEALKAHHRHVLAQWLDRQAYWNFRSLSHAVFIAIAQQGPQ